MSLESQIELTQHSSSSWFSSLPVLLPQRCNTEVNIFVVILFHVTEIAWRTVYPETQMDVYVCVCLCDYVTLTFNFMGFLICYAE